MDESERRRARPAPGAVDVGFGGIGGVVVVVDTSAVVGDTVVEMLGATDCADGVFGAVALPPTGLGAAYAGRASRLFLIAANDCGRSDARSASEVTTFF